MEAIASLTLSEEPHERPQQPVDSPAASLPVETLSRIFQLAVEGHPLERQRTTYAFARVCYLWSEVVPKHPTAYAVVGVVQVMRLTSKLESSNGWFRVTTLAVRFEACGWTRIVEPQHTLIANCTHLERLHIELLGRGAGGAFQMLSVIASLNNLVELAIGDTSMRAADLSWVLSATRSLRYLKLHRAILASPGTMSTVPTAVQHFDVPVNEHLLELLRSHLAEEGPPLTFVLRNTTNGDDASDELANTLLPIAERLHRIAAPNGLELSSSSGMRLVKSMINLRYLHLTYLSSTDGTEHNLPSPSRLQSLTELLEFKILASQTYTSNGRLALPYYLLELFAMPPSKLRIIEISSSLSEHWTPALLGAVERAAQEAKVSLAFV